MMMVKQYWFWRCKEEEQLFMFSISTQSPKNYDFALESNINQSASHFIAHNIIIIK